MKRRRAAVLRQVLSELSAPSPEKIKLAYRIQGIDRTVIGFSTENLQSKRIVERPGIPYQKVDPQPLSGARRGEPQPCKSQSAEGHE